MNPIVTFIFLLQLFSYYQKDERKNAIITFIFLLQLNLVENPYSYSHKTHSTTLYLR